MIEMSNYAVMLLTDPAIVSTQLLMTPRMMLPGRTPATSSHRADLWKRCFSHLKIFFQVAKCEIHIFFSIFWSPSPIVNPVWVLVSGDPWISNLMGWYSLRLLESMKRPWMHNYKWDLLNGMFFYQKWKIWLNNVKHPPYSVSRYSPFDFHSMPSFVVVRDAVQRFPPHHRFRLGHQTPAASWW